MDEESIGRILKTVKTERITLHRPYGGQNVNGGMMASGYRISHPEYEITIEISEGRSDIINLETAKLLFELALKEIYK